MMFNFSKPVKINHNLYLYSLKLLEEMLDNGFPLATELNILTELIKPPTIINKAVSIVTGKEG